MDDRIKLIGTRRHRSVCPIFDIGRRNRLEVQGSSVLLTIGDKYFLVTANHVMEPIKHEELFVCQKNGMQSLGSVIVGDIKGIRAISKSTKDDNIDIAYAELNCVTIDVFDDYEFLTIDDIQPHFEAPENNQYILIGWPATKTKPRYDRPGIHQEYLLYLTSLASKEVYENKSFSLIEVLALRTPSKALDVTGNLQKVPQLKGMSGCGVWSVPSDFSIDETKNSEKLVGIGISYIINEKVVHENVIFATRIAIVLEKIRTDHPELTSFIPMGSYPIR